MFVGQFNTTEQVGKQLALISRRIRAAVQLGVEALADLLQQHQSDLLIRGAGGPVGVEIDSGHAVGAYRRIGAGGAAQLGTTCQLESQSQRVAGGHTTGQFRCCLGTGAEHLHQQLLEAGLRRPAGQLGPHRRQCAVQALDGLAGYPPGRQGLVFRLVDHKKDRHGNQGSGGYQQGWAEGVGINEGLRHPKKLNKNFLVDLLPPQQSPGMR